MVKSLRFLVILIAVAIFGMIGSMQVQASNLYGVCGNTPSYQELKGAGSGSFYYGVAYEIYSNQAGASSIHARLEAEIDHALAQSDTLNLWLEDAKFNPDHTVYYVLLVDNSSNGDPNHVLSSVPAGSTIHINTYTNNFRIAAITSSTISSPVANLSFKVDNASDLNVGQDLYLAQVTQPDPNVDNYTIVSLGSGINVDPGLDASCDSYPEIKIHFTAPNDSASNKTFAKIEPKCSATVGSDLLNLGAELNTGTDFVTFAGGPNVTDDTHIETCNEGEGCGGSTCEACSSGCGHHITTTCQKWIVGNNFSCDNVEGSISFTLTSVAPESGVTVYYGDGTASKCTPNADNTQWTCSANDIYYHYYSGCLQIVADGQTTLNPTAWTISNLTVNPLPAPGANHLCIATKNGDAGAWYGGLEAMVPFVKSGNGYETYIKLYNRYDKDAKVYAASFKNGGSGRVMVALTQVGTITSGSYIQLTGAELATDLNISAADIANGMPIKFMIMVPGQKGCINVKFNDNARTENDIIQGCYNNTNDPYVEGIVVSVTPNGQRSIPLEFKYFKNGAYNQ